jgi:hypothetical protein
LLSPEAAASIEVKYVAEKIRRDASFSVSGFTASGLLLFLWDGGQPFFLNRTPVLNNNWGTEK